MEGMLQLSLQEKYKASQFSKKNNWQRNLLLRANKGKIFPYEYFVNVTLKLIYDIDFWKNFTLFFFKVCVWVVG